MNLGKNVFMIDKGDGVNINDEDKTVYPFSGSVENYPEGYFDSPKSVLITRQNYALYRDKVVSIRKILERNEFDVLVLDAKRIMGLEPAFQRYPQGTCPFVTKKVPGSNHYGQYLIPPKAGSIEWEYANHILSLIYPVVEIWSNGEGSLVVGLSDIAIIDEAQPNSCGFLRQSAGG